MHNYFFVRFVFAILFYNCVVIAINTQLTSAPKPVFLYYTTMSSSVKHRFTAIHDAQQECFSGDGTTCAANKWYAIMSAYKINQAVN
jgi:hypothetical protein